MLSRVSAALVKFLSPVSVSAESTRDSPLIVPSAIRRKKESPQDQSQSDFKRFQQEPEPEVSKSESEGLEAQTPDAPKSASPQSNKSVGTKLPGELGHNLTQLIFSFEGQKKLMKKWLGTQVYPHAAEEQKSGKLKKGIILDHKS